MGRAGGASTSALAYPLLVLVTTGSPALAGPVSALLAATTFVAAAALPTHRRLHGRAVGAGVLLAVVAGARWGRRAI